MNRALLFSVAGIASVLAQTARGADDDVQYFFQAERLEYLEAADALVWDLQGAVGDDYRKLWVKAEGEHAGGDSEENELQALYSRAFTPFFDWQIGLRHDFDPAPSRTHLVLGIQGLAPQWFEVDATAFVSEDGDISARLEAEYDLLLTQRLVLQPRLEIKIAANDVPELGLGSGITATDVDLRLRYEVHRKFAPYIGVAWHKLYGDTADLARAADEDDDEVSLVLGVSAWF